MQSRIREAVFGGCNAGKQNLLTEYLVQLRLNEAAIGLSSLCDGHVAGVNVAVELFAHQIVHL